MSRLFRRRRTWHGVLRMRPLLLLLAFLPSLFYLGHWDEFLNAGQGRVASPDHLAERLQHAGHHAHCHTGASTCSEQPAPANPRVIAAVVELPEPELPSVFIAEGTSSPEEYVLSLATEPPRF